MMEASKYVGVPHQDAPEEVAVAAAPVYNCNSPPLAKATKVDSLLVNGESDDNSISVTWEKGEVQPSAYRDKWFAIAFIAQLLMVLGVGMMLVGSAFAVGLWANDVAESEEISIDVDDDVEVGSEGSPPTPKGYWFAVVTIALVSAPALSFVALTIMSRNAILLIRASLWFSVGLCGLITVLLLAVNPFAVVIYGVFTVYLVRFTMAVQSRIPYAASNLKCAVTVLKTNLGLGLIALVSMMGLLLYSFCWVLAFILMIGAIQMYAMTESSDATSEDSLDLSAIVGIVGFLLILSFYWTHQVMKNVVRVTVSGVVGTWWFSPAEAASFCSDAVRHSLIRSTTFSFGSICFGSLIVAILHMLRGALARAQNSRIACVLRCITGCILFYIEGLAEYFNKWAYVYVGLYGYGYIDAGKSVNSLFKTRGWQTIISDNLVGRLLGITCLAIGLFTGVLTLFAALLVEEFEAKGDMQFWLFVGFKIGFFIGLILSNVFMGMVLDAVDAILVCYAEAPNELQKFHPAVAEEMSKTWAEAWGESRGMVIVVLGGELGVV